MTTALWMLGVYGAAVALTMLHIGEFYRWIGEKVGGPLKELTICPTCTAFWIGLGLSVFVWSPMTAGIGELPWPRWAGLHLVDALAGSGLTFMLHSIVNRLLLDEPQS